MKVFKEIGIPSRVVKQLDSLICDKCDQEIDETAYSAYDADWFELREGSSFPEGGSGTSIVMELCQECSEDLVDLLHKNGYKTRKEEWDW